MAKDYAKAKTKTESPSAAKSLSQTLAMWLSTILLIFLFALGLFFLGHQDQLTEHKPFAAKKKVVIKTKAIAIKSSKPRFEFYNLLTSDKSHQKNTEATQEAEQATEQHTVAEKATPEQQQKPSIVDAKPTVNKFFYLQVASFRNPEDAETMKAKLSLAGYTVTIQKSYVRNDYWHRVFVGPYSDRGDAAAAQTALRRHKVNGLIRDLS